LSSWLTPVFPPWRGNEERIPLFFSMRRPVHFSFFSPLRQRGHGPRWVLFPTFSTASKSLNAAPFFFFFFFRPKCRRSSAFSFYPHFLFSFYDTNLRCFPTGPYVLFFLSPFLTGLYGRGLFSFPPPMRGASTPPPFFFFSLSEKPKARLPLFFSPPFSFSAQALILPPFFFLQRDSIRQAWVPVPFQEQQARGKHQDPFFFFGIGSVTQGLSFFDLELL